MHGGKSGCAQPVEQVRPPTRFAGPRVTDLAAAFAGEAVTPEFPIITPHDLRHTCASLAISAKANVKVLQNLLGHKTATLTFDRYGHLFPMT